MRFKNSNIQKHLFNFEFLSIGRKKKEQKMCARANAVLN